MLRKWLNDRVANHMYVAIAERYFPAGHGAYVRRAGWLAKAPGRRSRCAEVSAPMMEQALENRPYESGMLVLTGPNWKDNGKRSVTTGLFAVPASRRTGRFM